MQFAFREPYQVLVNSDCLRAITRFAMPTQQFLENTLDGKATPYITQCTLARVMEGYSGKGRGGRPDFLPPPTEVPLRYCKHKDENGQPREVLPEAECLLDLISGHAKGNEQRKNKNHYILAVADWAEGVKDEEEKKEMHKQRKKRQEAGESNVDIRQHARTIPGVPIIYVKKSIMELEQLGPASERAVKGIEKDKYKDGIGGATRGTKRSREDESDEEKAAREVKRPVKKVKGANPLATKKKQPKQRQENDSSLPDTDSVNKQKRKRGRRGKSSKTNEKVDVQQED